jgi:hypothetical protein
MPYIHKFILLVYKSNKTILMSYRKFPDKGDNPNKYIVSVLKICFFLIVWFYICILMVDNLKFTSYEGNDCFNYTQTTLGRAC